MKKVLPLLALAAALGVAGWLRSRTAGRTAPAPARELRLLVATSLGPVFEELARDLEAAHPGLSARIELGGSLVLARKLADVGAPCDAIALADAEVFDEVLVPRGAVSAYRVLGSTRLGIVSAPGSKLAAELTAASWHEVLRRPGLRIGRADPDGAPAGYRTLVLFQLAEKRLGVPGLARALEAASPPRFVRANLATLGVNVQAGELDAAFDYEASAVAKNLSFLRLPAELDQSDPRFAALYATASVEVAGTRPGERRTVHGAPIRYGIAVPAASRSPEVAGELVRLATGPRGAEVLARHGFIPDGALAGAPAR